MTEIYHHKFSLFKLERPYQNSTNYAEILFTSCFEYINTFKTLKEAKSVQKELKYKSIILPSY